MEVHRAGCNDLNKSLTGGGRRVLDDHVDSLTDAAEDLAGDFITEGSMTVDQAIGEQTHWGPCASVYQLD
jgi:hypothetical protein